MVLVQNCPFFQLFFFRQYRPRIVCYDILARKNAFLGYKNIKFKKSEIDIFPKGLTHTFGIKMAIFPTFFLDNIGQENVFYHIVEREIAFLGYKNIMLTKAKNWHFSKGVNPWFWSKNGHFSNFFFWQNRQGKCLFSQPRTRKTSFLAIKT